MIGDISVFTVHGKILILLYKNRNSQEPITNKILTEEFAVSPSTMSGHVTDLEDQGFVIRKKDGKSKPIELTNAGIRLVEDAKNYIS